MGTFSLFELYISQSFEEDWEESLCAFLLCFLFSLVLFGLPEFGRVVWRGVREARADFVKGFSPWCCFLLV